MAAHIYGFCRIQLQYFAVSSRPLPAHFGPSPAIWISSGQSILLGFPGGSDGEESTCSVGDPSSIPGLESSPGGGHGNPLQYSCLGNPKGQRSLVGYSWGDHKEPDMTERLSTSAHHLSCYCLSWVQWVLCTDRLLVCLKSEVKARFCQQPRTSPQSWMAGFSSHSRTCPYTCAKCILTPTLAYLLG